MRHHLNAEAGQAPQLMQVAERIDECGRPGIAGAVSPDAFSTTYLLAALYGARNRPAVTSTIATLND